MIAFNKLLENIDEYSYIYKLMGHKEDLFTFVVYEDERKELQMKFEEAKARCNKLCSEVATLRKENKETTSHIKEIKKLNSRTRTLQRYLNFWGNIIDTKLKTLPNIPDKNNEINLQIETSKTPVSFGAVSNFLKSFMPTKYEKYSMDSFIKKQKGKIFEESDLLICTFLRDGITVLCTDEDVDDTLNKITDFFTKNSLSMVCLSFKVLEKSSSQEYLIELNDSHFMKIELKREYYTRAFKIKYKNKKQDMTRFVNQINIKYL